MPNTASDTLPPTRKQLAYLRKLAQRAGQTFTGLPASMWSG